ncbi:uncharacterized protein BXZ73DRAFT_108599 [Epithele typhae]|uniref:uncharacterized protein n=1 Tax=Epithele typhae TaxID=378194 RepID=UPI002007FED6|nr:uncharacterized protein BXZ73DRAFT_108599 [Epithele typhae]KAH9910704.1 hypothetical protein BXZ73DRAFT_108599 [Epithele typhae]
MDLHRVGVFVAWIVADPCTLGKKVVAYDDELTVVDVWAVAFTKSGAAEDLAAGRITLNTLPAAPIPPQCAEDNNIQSGSDMTNARGCREAPFRTTKFVIPIISSPAIFLPSLPCPSPQASSISPRSSPDLTAKNGYQSFPETYDKHTSHRSSLAFWVAINPSVTANGVPREQLEIRVREQREQNAVAVIQRTLERQVLEQPKARVVEPLGRGGDASHEMEAAQPPAGSSRVQAQDEDTSAETSTTRTTRPVGIVSDAAAPTTVGQPGIDVPSDAHVIINNEGGVPSVGVEDGLGSWCG